MANVVEDAEYVLAILHTMRDLVPAYPKFFDPDAQQRIDEAIDHAEHVFRLARSQFTASVVEQKVKAA